MQNVKNPNTFYSLGLIKEKQGDTAAFESFKMAYYVNPSYSNAIYKVAKLNVQKKRFFNAAGFIEKGLKLNPESTRFLNRKGRSFYYKKEYEQTIETLTQVVALGINTEQVHDCLAISYAKIFQYQKAIVEYIVLLSQYNNLNPNYHYNMGKCLMGIGDFENGHSYVKTAISILDISLQDEYVTVAVAYSREQKYQEAFDYLKRAIKEDSKSDEAHYQLAVAADNFYKDDGEVLKLYKNYMKLFGQNGRYYPLASARAKDLAETLFFKEGK
jgi:tetratricopeptide (TPR) repeat protein